MDYVDVQMEVAVDYYPVDQQLVTLALDHVIVLVKGGQQLVDDMTQLVDDMTQLVTLALDHLTELVKGGIH